MKKVFFGNKVNNKISLRFFPQFSQQKLICFDQSVEKFISLAQIWAVSVKKKFEEEAEMTMLIDGAAVVLDRANGKKRQGPPSKSTLY